MFEIKPDIRMTTQEKLLFNIQELLKGLVNNEKIETETNQNEQENKTYDIDNMKRQEIMKELKQFNNLPDGWIKLPNEELKMIFREKVLE